MEQVGLTRVFSCYIKGGFDEPMKFDFYTARGLCFFHRALVFFKGEIELNGGSHFFPLLFSLCN